MAATIAAAPESGKPQRASHDARYGRMPSSVIRGWTYDEAEHRLDIIFVSGKRYSYHEVPPRVAEGMRKAFSKGSYFNRRIRDHFAFTERRARPSLADQM